MADHTGIFNGRAREKEDGEFITVDFQKGGTQTVRYTLWASRKVLNDIAGDPAMAGLSGEAMFKALCLKGAYPSNAWKQADGTLHPMPCSDEKRANIELENIIPCLQKFYKCEDAKDPRNNYRFLVKYSDHYGPFDDSGLDDPLSGVPAVLETSVEPPHHPVHAEHHKNGRQHGPEKCFYPSGHLMWEKQWVEGVNKHANGKPRFEEFDDAGHPVYLEDNQDNTVIKERFDPLTGEVILAETTDERGRHHHVMTQQEVKTLPPPPLPQPGI